MYSSLASAVESHLAVVWPAACRDWPFRELVTSQADGNENKYGEKRRRRKKKKKKKKNGRKFEGGGGRGGVDPRHVTQAPRILPPSVHQLFGIFFLLLRRL